MNQWEIDKTSPSYKTFKIIFYIRMHIAMYAKTGDLKQIHYCTEGHDYRGSGTLYFDWILQVLYEDYED